MNATRYAVNRRVAMGIIVVAMVVLGLYGLSRLPVNFLPDITYPLIKVHIWWPGATPEEIDRQIADPLERQMATVDGLDFLESSSIEGMYTLQANFKYGVDVDVAYQDATAALARVARQLPKEMDPPVIIKADPSQLPVVQLTISSDTMDLVKLRTWTEDWLQLQMISVSGVAGTEIVGGLKREIRINIDPVAVEKFGLSIPAIVKKLSQENIEDFGGRVTETTRELIARTTGEYKTLDEIRSVVLTRTPQGNVYLSDVATISDANAEVRVITRLGGKPCVKLSILKQADANTVEVARAVTRKIDSLRDSFPAGIKMEMVENQADYVQAAINGVRNTALEAAVLVILTVYLFLGSWRQVLVMVLALPLTLIINFGLMKLGGFSLNIFSLSGLVVAVGVALDNSIVVIENITRLQHGSETLSPTDAVVTGTSMVGQALIAATVSFLALFLPFLLVPGLTSLLFRELILVIAGVMLISLFMAITVTPLIAVMLLSNQQRTKSRFELFFEQVAEKYGLLLERALGRGKIVIAASIAILIVLFGLGSLAGSEFLPRMDDGRIMVKVKLPTGASLEQTNGVLKSLEAKLLDDPTIESLFTLAGGKVWGLYTYEIANEGELNIQLISRHDRNISTADYVKKIRPIVAQVSVPGGKVIVAPMKVKGIRSLGEADVEALIRGEDVYTLFDIAQKVSGSMNELKHFTNVFVSMDLSKPELQTKVDRARAAALGVTVSDVATNLKSLISGAVATKLRDGDKQYDIRVKIPEQNMSRREDIENLAIMPTENGYLRVRDVATVTPSTGPVEIIRYNQVKQVVVRGDAFGASVGQALDELQSAMKKQDLPVGYEISYGGQAQMMSEMKMNVLAILVFAVFFCFVVLTVQFNTMKLPLLILAGLPFCMAGLVFALAATGLPMGATVLIGALVVIAAHVNEGVLILTLAEELRVKDGLNASDAMVQAAKIRLRPRLMISFMIIMGLLPLAVNLESGGEMLQPMAVGAIGGLFVVIFVSLFLIPCLYVQFAEKQNYAQNPFFRNFAGLPGFVESVLLKIKNTWKKKSS
jgi:hydrophobic/amphiphilic exporter-1 (mainly G- bacteria), HAE1 family